VATRTASPPQSVDASRRIPKLPALDGLRAVAVAAVLLWHADVVRVQGGYLGVESFFVISGYLITALLWTERTTTGRTSLRRFWLRRARRLLPALYLMLLVVTAALVIGWRDLVARARGDAAAAALYVANWYQLTAKQSYFQETGRPSPFRHLWSLAVEEQFYLVWPLLLLVLVYVWHGDRARIAASVAFLALMSGLAMGVTFALRHDPGASVPYDPSRLYYGLDTRAGGLLLGCALALVWRPWERPDAGRSPILLGRVLPRWWGDAAGLTGLGVLVACFWRLASDAPFVYAGGLQLVAVATALVIAGTAWPGSVVALVLGAKPLVAVGRRSYSLYLWHWPVYVVTRPELDLPWTSGPTLAFRLALSAALAELSYRYVECPIRNGALGRAGHRVQAAARSAAPQRRRQLLKSWAAVTAGAVTLLLVLAVVVVRADPPPPLDSALSAASDPGVAAGNGRATDPLVVSGADDLSTTPSTNPPPPGADPNAAAPGSPVTVATRAKVYAIGDSVMLGARPALASVIPSVTVDAKVGRYMAEGRKLVELLARKNLMPDTLVVHLGSNGPASRSDVEGIIRSASGNKVVFVTVKVPRRWEETSNSAIVDGAAGQPNVKVVDWNRLSGDCQGGDTFYEDGTHLKEAGATCYANLIKAAMR